MLALLLAAAAAATSPAPTPIRLADLLAEARAANPELLAARADAAAARDDVRPAGALDDPMATVQLWNAPADLSTAPIMLQLQQALPIAKLAARRRQAEQGARAVDADAGVTALDVAMRVKDAFFDLVVADRSLEADDEIERTTQGLVEAAGARLAAGKGEQVEVLRAQAELLRLRGDLEAVRARRRAAVASLLALLHRDPTGDLVATRMPGMLPTLPSLAELIAKALASRPEVESSDARIAEARAGRALAGASRAPDLTLSAAEMHNFGAPAGAGPADFLFAGAQVNLPLFGAAKSRPRIRAADARLEAARQRASATRDRIASEVVSARAQVDADQVEVELHHQLLPVARQAVESAVAGYSAGKVDFTTLVDSRRDLQMHELDLAMDVGDYEKSVAALERAVGADLGLVEAADAAPQTEEH